MVIFGLVHSDPGFLQAVGARLEAMPATRQCDWARGEAFILGVQASGGHKNIQDGVWSSGRVHVALSGEINSCSVPDVSGWSADRPQSSCAALFAELYRRFGSGSVSKTSGHFSVAVWDEEQRELRLFLDRTGGIKTLYYTRLPRGFAFCSSLGMLASVLRLRKEVNESLISELFATGYILPPRTLLKGISKICPGEEVLYHEGEVRCRRVDTIHFHSSAAGKKTVDELEDRLTNSLTRLTKEAGAGFLLSGGIDSSILVALASQRLNKSVTAFSASFPGSSLDESAYAQIVAQANNCSCELIDLNQTHTLDDLPEIIWNLGEPFLDFSVIPTFHLFRRVRQKTSIIISGDGPDHLFARYYPLAAKRYVGARFQGAIARMNNLPFSFPSKIRRAAEVSQYEAYRGLFSIPAWGESASRTLAGMLNVPVPLEYNGGSFLADMEIPPESDFAGCMDAMATLDFYIDGSCGVFAKVGRMADAHGLTLREPYLDREVSDLIAHLPLQQKQRGPLVKLLASRAKNKWLLKYGLGPRYLPAKIIRKKKGGFTPPLKQWLSEVICPMPVSQILCSTVRNENYFDVIVVEKILQQHKLGIHDYSMIIFLIISFDLWIRLFIEKEYDSFCGQKLMEVYG